MAYIIPVIRFIPQLKKTLKSRTISRPTLDTYDDYFKSIMSSYPEHLQIRAEGYLEPVLLHAVFPLQAARVLLYRHNLTTLCQPHERSEAMSRCLLAAHDTLKYIQRTMMTPAQSPDQRTFGGPPQESFRDLIRGQADNFLCKHIWRVTLILCFKGDYNAALTCVQLSSTIGDIRKVNVACGRNLSLFLARLYERVKAGVATHLLEADEEMLAYASGDLQGDPENAWVWAGSESDFVNGAPANPDDLPPSSALLTEKELADWGGWERVKRLLHELIDEQQRQSRPQNPYHQPLHNPTKRLQLSQPDTSPTSGAVSSPGPSAGAARISIANII
jgi:hypothetical protein